MRKYIVKPSQTVDPSAVAHLRELLMQGVNSHKPKADSLYHNGGTALALAATGAATIIPSSHAIWIRVAAAFATFIIAISRALDFGGRWRWHLDMRTRYQALLDRTDELEVLPDAEKLDAIKTIYDDLEALRMRENSVPGAGVATTPSAAP